MEQIVFTHNGLSLVAILLEECLNMNKIFYLQGRIILTDDTNHEIRSMDILHAIRALQNDAVKITFSEC